MHAIYWSDLLKPNKKISVFQVTGLKNLGRHVFLLIFFLMFFSGKKYNFMHFERHFAFQNALKYTLSRTPEKF